MPCEIGVNIAWFGGAYGHDLGKNQAYPGWPIWYNGAGVDELLGILKSYGVRLARVWLFEEGEGLVYGNDDAIGLDEQFLTNLDDLVRRVASAGMQVYWTLFDANRAGAGADRITAPVLSDPLQARVFAENVLPIVLPRIQQVAWAIDLCNEPEAIVAEQSGNRTSTGWTWAAIQPSLLVLRDSVRRISPGVPVSIGSGWHNDENVAKGIYERLNLNLDFYDYHQYSSDGESPSDLPRRLTKPVVIGEIGCVARESSDAEWERVQACIVKSIEDLSLLGYRAAFLWYLSDPQAGDAMSLVYRNRIGAALRSLY